MRIQIGVWREWSDARPLIAAELSRRQCPSLTTYVAAEPQTDLLDIARSLEICGVHSGHIVRQLWEEAAESGQIALCARDLLVRALCARLGGEEPAPLDLQLEDAGYQWGNELPLNYRRVGQRILAALLAVLPPSDWVPQDANDSVLVGLFGQHWPAEDPGLRYRVAHDSAGGLTIEPDRDVPGERGRSEPRG